MKKNITIFLSIIISTLTFFSCGFSFSHDQLKSNINPRGRIAVLIADNRQTESSLKYANVLTAHLIKNTTFEVVSQAQVAGTLPGYPERIQGPYKTAMVELNENYSLTDTKTLEQIANKLRVQFLYVFWMPIGFDLDHGIIEYSHINQMYEFPGGKEILRLKSKFQFMKKGSSAIGYTFKSEEDYYAYWAEKYSIDIGKKLNASKIKAK